MTVVMTVAEGVPATTHVVAGETIHATLIVTSTAGPMTRHQTEVPLNQGNALTVAVATSLASADETVLTDVTETVTPTHGPKTRTQDPNHHRSKVDPDKRSAKTRPHNKINQAKDCKG